MAVFKRTFEIVDKIEEVQNDDLLDMEKKKKMIRYCLAISIGRGVINIKDDLKGELLMNQYKDMTTDYLIKTYIPDVYQKSIFNIDYEQLKNAGIKLISFDIDDTIVPIEKHDPTKAAITLFEKIKKKGFELILVSNANDDRVQRFGEKLGVRCISRASKPHTDAFDTIRQMYVEKYDTELSPKEMAHVGNSMIKDVATGNTYGVTTCLVRNVGKLPTIGKILNPKKTEGQLLREVLLDKGIWRKHHLKTKGDQYYQLNETYMAQKSIEKK